jgi:alpha-tubulin suppressor-like RCC1 family protein
LVTGGVRFASLIAGRGNDILEYTCGLTGAGAAYCWGMNESGKLGAPTTQQCTFGNSGFGCSATPLSVSGSLLFSTLTLGVNFACGLTKDGVTYCWGDNALGQLGTGTTTGSAVPVRVASLP